eukprot:jgi/Ulvmu1/11595/UM079_0039.1
MDGTGSFCTSGLLRLHVRPEVDCTGTVQEAACQSYPFGLTVCYIGTDGDVLGASLDRASSGRRGRIRVSWRSSDSLPIPAILSQLQIDADLDAVQVYFCSPCWQRAPLLTARQRECDTLRMYVPLRNSHPDAWSRPTLHSELLSLPFFQHHSDGIKSVLGGLRLLCSTPAARSPKHEWFSMSVRTVKCRVNGYYALSPRNFGPQHMALMWQAMGTAVLSYAVAWSFAYSVAVDFQLTTDEIDPFFRNCHQLLSWLCKEPGGFKVHTEWASALAQLGHLGITIANKLASATAAHAQLFLTCLRWAACFGGCQLALCLVADAIFALTLPIVIVHMLSTTVQRWQVAAVTLTWDMVRNRVNARAQLRAVFKGMKRTMRQPWLRNGACITSPTQHISPQCTSPQNPVEEGAWPDTVARPDKDVMVEQMLIGMLFLAPLAATLPTTWLLHCVFTVVHAGLAMLRACVYAAAVVLDSGCAYRSLCWAAQPVFGGAFLGAAPDVKFVGTHPACLAPYTHVSVRSRTSNDAASMRMNRNMHSPSSASQRDMSSASNVLHQDSLTCHAGHDYRACEVSYYQVGAGYVSFVDALRPSLCMFSREMSFIMRWFSMFPWNGSVT